MPRNTVKPGTPHDFTVKVTIDRHPVRFFVHKRPHVDFFLDVVSTTKAKNLFQFSYLNFKNVLKKKLTAAKIAIADN